MERSSHLFTIGLLKQDTFKSLVMVVACCQIVAELLLYSLLCAVGIASEQWQLSVD